MVWILPAAGAEAREPVEVYPGNVLIRMVFPDESAALRVHRAPSGSCRVCT